MRCGLVGLVPTSATPATTTATPSGVLRLSCIFGCSGFFFVKRLNFFLKRLNSFVSCLDALFAFDAIQRQLFGGGMLGVGSALL